MNVEMDHFFGGWMAQLDWIASSWSVAVKFFHNRIEEAIVVLNTRREHSVQSDIRHEAAQPTIEIENFGCHGSERDVFLDFSAVRCESVVKGMLLGRLSLVILFFILLF